MKSEYQSETNIYSLKNMKKLSMPVGFKPGAQWCKTNALPNVKLTVVLRYELTILV